MDREILYRGLNFQKEWVYGDLFHSYANDDIAIAYYREGCKTPTFDAIFPESFGQYTGLTDKNGVKIFEGDIISLGDPNIKYLTMWYNAGFAVKQIGASSYIGLTYWASDIEVLGNVIDNHELINLKSATKPLNVLIAFTRPLITEFADNLNLKHPLLPTISPYPTM